MAVRVARVTRVVARVAARVAVRLAVREAVAKESEGGGGEAGGEHIGCGEERRGEGEEWAGPSRVARPEEPRAAGRTLLAGTQNCICPLSTM